MVVLAVTIAVVTVVVFTVVVFAAEVVFTAAVVMVSPTAVVFALLPPPLVTGTAAIPVVRLTDKDTDPWPTVVVPLVRDLPS